MPRLTCIDEIAHHGAAVELLGQAMHVDDDVLCAVRQFTRRLRQRDGDRLADAEFLRLGRARLDQDRRAWRAPRGCRSPAACIRRCAAMKLTLARQPLRAAVAGDGDGVADLDARQHRLAARRSASCRLSGGSSDTTGRPGRHRLAGPVIDLLDGAGGRARAAAARQPRLRPVEIAPWPGAARLRRRRASSACRRRSCSSSCARSKACCALVTAACFTTRSAFCRSSSSVNSRSPASTVSPSRTFSVSTRPCSSGLTKMRSASTQPCSARSSSLAAGGERQQRQARRAQMQFALSCRPPGANNSSRCVFIIARTSSGSKRSNSPLQMIGDQARRGDELRKIDQRVGPPRRARRRARAARARRR